MKHNLSIINPSLSSFSPLVVRLLYKRGTIGDASLSDLSLLSRILLQWKFYSSTKRFSNFLTRWYKWEKVIINKYSPFSLTLSKIWFISPLTSSGRFVRKKHSWQEDIHPLLSFPFLSPVPYRQDIHWVSVPMVRTYNRPMNPSARWNTYWRCDDHGDMWDNLKRIKGVTHFHKCENSQNKKKIIIPNPIGWPMILHSLKITLIILELEVFWLMIIITLTYSTDLPSVE